jgi:hypothetical protein
MVEDKWDCKFGNLQLIFRFMDSISGAFKIHGRVYPQIS